MIFAVLPTASVTKQLFWTSREPRRKYRLKQNDEP